MAKISFNNNDGMEWTWMQWNDDHEFLVWVGHPTLFLPVDCRFSKWRMTISSSGPALMMTKPTREPNVYTTSTGILFLVECHHEYYFYTYFHHDDKNTIPTTSTNLKDSIFHPQKQPENVASRAQLQLLQQNAYSNPCIIHYYCIGFPLGISSSRSKP